MQKYFLILLLSITTTVSAQGIRIGLGFEPGIVFTEHKGESDILPAIFSFKGILVIEPSELFRLEARPGVLLATDQFTGIEIGSFAAFNIPGSDFSALLGLNSYFNVATSGHNRGSYGEYFPFYGVGIGYNADTRLRFDLTYYWTSKKEYAYSIETDDDGYRYRIDKIINGLVRLGFNLSFEIFSFN